MGRGQGLDILNPIRKGGTGTSSVNRLHGRQWAEARYFLALMRLFTYYARRTSSHARRAVSVANRS